MFLDVFKVVKKNKEEKKTIKLSNHYTIVVTTANGIVITTTCSAGVRGLGAIYLVFFDTYN